MAGLRIGVLATSLRSLGPENRGAILQDVSTEGASSRHPRANSAILLDGGKGRSDVGVLRATLRSGLLGAVRLRGPGDVALLLTPALRMPLAGAWIVATGFGRSPSPVGVSARRRRKAPYAQRARRQAHRPPSFLAFQNEVKSALRLFAPLMH